MYRTEIKKLAAQRAASVENRAAREAAWQEFMDKLGDGSIPPEWETIDGVPVLPKRPRNGLTSRPFPHNFHTGVEPSVDDEDLVGAETNLALSVPHFAESAAAEELREAIEEARTDKSYLQIMDFINHWRLPRCRDRRGWKVKAELRGKCYVMPDNSPARFAGMRRNEVNVEAPKPTPVVETVAEVVDEPNHEPAYHQARGLKFGKAAEADLLAEAIRVNAARLDNATFEVELPSEYIVEVFADEPDPEMPPPLPVMTTEQKVEPEAMRAPAPPRPRINKMSMADWLAMQTCAA